MVVAAAAAVAAGAGAGAAGAEAGKLGLERGWDLRDQGRHNDSNSSGRGEAATVAAVAALAGQTRRRWMRRWRPSTMTRETPGETIAPPQRTWTRKWMWTWTWMKTTRRWSQWTQHLGQRSSCGYDIEPPQPRVSAPKEEQEEAEEGEVGPRRR